MVEDVNRYTLTADHLHYGVFTAGNVAPVYGRPCSVRCAQANGQYHQPAVPNGCALKP